MNTILKSLKKPLKVIIIILLCILIPIVIFVAIHPTSMPDKYAKKYLLLKVPVGTTMAEAKSIFKKNDWEINTIELDHGIYYGPSGQPRMYIPQSYDQSRAEKLKMVGSKFIFVEIDEYRIIFDEADFAYYIFDENDKLIDVDIRRDIDSI
jgi:hypothetical protein